MKRTLGIWLLVAFALPHWAFGQHTEVLVEYRQVPGFWNRVARFPDYHDPQKGRNEANFEVLGTISPEGDTTMGPRAAQSWQTRELADTLLATPQHWRLSVDTLADWKIMHPSHDDQDTYTSASVWPVYLTNNGTEPQYLPLVPGGQLALQGFVYQEGARTHVPSSYPLHCNKPYPSTLRIPPGGSVLTLYRFVHTGTHRELTPNYHQLILIVEDQVVAESNPFFAYW